MSFSQIHSSPLEPHGLASFILGMDFGGSEGTNIETRMGSTKESKLTWFLAMANPQNKCWIWWPMTFSG